MAGESEVNLEPTHSPARPPTSTRTLIGEAAGDRLGFSIPLSDDGIRLAIGAIFKDRKGENAGPVFDWTGCHSKRTWWLPISTWNDVSNEIKSIPR